MNRDDLAKTLFASAERRAALHGMQFGEGADGDIRQFARKSADRIFAEHTANVPAERTVTAATAAFEQLVDEMVSAASQISSYREAHPDMIGEQTLARALARLCPLFPIC